MRRIVTLLLLAALLLGGCAAGDHQEERAEALQRKYAALAAWSGTVEAAVPREEEMLRYVLRMERKDGATRAEVLEPENIAGISATVKDDALSVAFEGMVLDAGKAGEKLNAVNGADLTVNAIASGYVTERSVERFGEEDALRLCFESGAAGEKMLCTVFFDAEDRPLHAEWEREGEILLYLEFTDFTFDDILPLTEK